MFVSSSAHGWPLSFSVGVTSPRCSQPELQVVCGAWRDVGTSRRYAFPLSHEVCGTAVKAFVANMLYEGCNVAQSESQNDKGQESWLISYSTT